MDYRMIDFNTKKVIKEFDTLREMVRYFNTEYIENIENVIMQEYDFKNKKFVTIF